MPSDTRRLGPHTLNHQSFLPNSDSTLRMARRKSSASAMLSSTSAVPPGGSIMAAATSQDAIIAYWGDVEVCIRYASLNTLRRSEEHTSELQSLMRISYAVFCLKKKTQNNNTN